MHDPRDPTAAGLVGYGCLAALVLLVVPVASFAVIFLWNVNAHP